MIDGVWRLIAACVIMGPALGRAAETVTVTEVSGATSAGTLKSWTNEKLVMDSTETRNIPQSDIRSLKFERPEKSTLRTEPSVWLTSGERISARAASADDETLSILWSIERKDDLRRIPLEEVVAMIFEWPQTIRDQLRLIADLETLPAGNDLVMLTNGDRSLGEFLQLDDAFVVLKVAGKPVKIDRSRVRAVRLNPELATMARPSGVRTVVLLTDGSHLVARRVSVDNETVQIESFRIGEISVPIEALVSCHCFGERLVPVTDYDPAKIEFTPYLSSEWQLVPNANVFYGPLTLRGTEFVTGLGMHSRMAVTYELRGDERQFIATVGIDDVAHGLGSAIFAIDLDGQRIWTSPELNGRSPLKSTPNLPVQGGKRLTLTVDFGQFADVSDYADWCDAMFVKDATAK